MTNDQHNQVNYSYHHTGLQVTPGRPAIPIKGLMMELENGRGIGGSWDFGYVDKLESSRIVARDSEGNVVDTNPDIIFSDRDYEVDPEYLRLIRYLDVAEDETFILDDEHAQYIPNFLVQIDEFTVERPSVADVASAASFLPAKCRIWLTGGSWNGVTRFDEAVSDGLLTSHQVEAIGPKIGIALRRDALTHALAPFSDSEELLRKIGEAP